MKPIVKCLVAAGLTCAVNMPAFAVEMRVMGKGYGGTLGGGEFLLDTNGDQVVDLVTFSLELNENIVVGSPLPYTIDAAAIGGGFHGGSPDPLSLASAWIFDHYLDGSLSSSLTGAAKVQYDNADSNGKADSVQLALWYLEQETSTGNMLSQWAEANVAPRNVHNNGTIGVGVLNPTDPAYSPTDPEYNAQSFLIPQDPVIPVVRQVPEGKVWLSMIPVGLAAGALFRRRRQQAAV